MARQQSISYNQVSGIESHPVIATIVIAMMLAAALTPSLQAQTFTVLHEFTGGRDGMFPQSVALDARGNLYGNNDGGVGGIIFRLQSSGSNWLLNPLLTISDGSPNTSPNQLTVTADNTLYASNFFGGNFGGPCDPNTGCGVVFKVRPPASVCLSTICPWTATILYQFSGAPNDGQQPQGNVILDAAGNLYGTTEQGGTSFHGTVYKLRPNGDGWTETILYNFAGGDDGSLPFSGVVFDRAGNLYGTTSEGGRGNFGTVYQLTPSGGGWTERVIYTFRNGNDGSNPVGGLTVDSAGNLFGTTFSGGAGNGGTVFELTPSGGNWTYHLLYALQGEGNRFGPAYALVPDVTGNLYGSAGGGPTNEGTIFKLARSGQGWTYTDLYDFSGGFDGSAPGGIAIDSQGNIFGAATNGGHFTCEFGELCGNIFELTP